VYLDKQEANALHLLPFPNRNLDKAFLRMTNPSMNLALPQVACCHTETEPKLSAAKHN
jgi:hypothetical protein